MKRKWSGLRISLLRATVIPIIVCGIVITLYCSRQFANSIHQEVESELKNIAQSAVYIYERDFPGDYYLDSESSVVYKGEKRVDAASDVLEQLKKISGADITIFYKDLRIVTTIRDNEGKPIIGTKANSVVKKEVLNGEEEHFYAKTTINGEGYFSYYCPIYNVNGDCAGMAFAGKSSQYVRGIVLKGVIPIVSIIALVILTIVIIMCVYANRLTKSMQQLQNFLAKVESGNLTTELGRMVSKRKDELGKIGQSAIQMQSALRELVEKDSLTGLYNRHYGEMWLQRVVSESGVTGAAFFVAIADIDFFKGFNDEHGHDCGDMVLKEVSGILKKGVRRKGYASRWGGEEFLLVFKDKDWEEAVSTVNCIADEIRNLSIEYGDEKLGVTLTIGMTAGDCDIHMDELIKRADQALYEGKKTGRNKVVCYDHEASGCEDGTV